MSDYLEGYSPFQTELGRFMNMARIGLGEDRGWLELSTTGEMSLYSATYPDGPVFTFNAEDAEILIAAGQELATMIQAWQERRKDQEQRRAQSTEEEAEAEPCPANPAARAPNKAPEFSQPGPKASSNERCIQVEMPAAIISKNGNGHHQHALKLAGD
jgi:hypothetical protein